MHSCKDIEENRFFGNGGPNLHILKIAQSCFEDNQDELLQGPHGIANPPKNLILDYCQVLQMANGLMDKSVMLPSELSDIDRNSTIGLKRCTFILHSIFFSSPSSGME